MPYAQGIQKSEDVRDTVTIESLLTTSDSAYSKTDVNSGTLSKEDGDVDGPFDLGVSITETVDTDKETHIIYYSTSNTFNIKKSISSQLAVSIYTNQVSIFPPFRIKQEYTEESINTVECPLKPAVLSPSPHNIWPTSFYAKRKGYI